MAMVAPRLLALVFALIAMAAVASPASAQTTRQLQGSFGFGGSASSRPDTIAVDQTTGDVYVIDQLKHIVLRFGSGGAPDNFTAGPDAGTNTLTGFQTGVDATGPDGVAVDNSGGPLDGDVYVSDGASGAGANNTSTIKIFSGSGARLGEITEAGAPPFGTELEEDPNAPSNHLYGPCGIAVDQSDGSLYVSEEQSAFGPAHIWRYAPSSPSGPIDRSDYALTGVHPSNGSPCGLAAAAGSVYAIEEGSLHRYEAAAFTATFPTVEGAGVASNVLGVAADSGDGDVYVDEGFQIAVLDHADKPLYSFARPREIAAGSAGIAVRSAASGAAAKAYVTDGEPGASLAGQVYEYGPVTHVQAYTLPERSAFGPDASAFVFLTIALDQATRALYAVTDPFGIFGFDVSAPPAFPALSGFDPLSTANPGFSPSLAVDNSGGVGDGNIYFVSSNTGLVYGFDASGSPLGGAFPIDPEVSPGAPDGSPKEVGGVAVDSAGHIWVANMATKRILEYSSSGAWLGVTIDASAVGKPYSLAFDAENNLYVAGFEEAGPGTGVWRFAAASGYTASVRIDSRWAGEIAVDRASGRVFVSHRGVSLEQKYVGWIDEYDEAGNFVADYVGGLNSSWLAVAVEETNHDVYVADSITEQIRAFGPPAILPEVRVGSAVGVSNSGAALNGTVATQQVALTDCHFEYVSEEAFRVSGFSDLSSGGSVPCVQAPGSIPLDFEEHAVSANVAGLANYTDYRFRLVAANAQGSLASANASFTTSSSPGVEIAGAPDRGASTAVLNGRVNPRNGATTFHFEYGDQGPCDANPCVATPDRSAGSGNEIEMVASQIEGLQPNTTYHYRLVAENGNSAGVSTSAGMTVTTRASDAPLTRGHLSGPPDSDRAYEQVSIPDSGGNPVGVAIGFSEDGNRALYQLNGGSPTTDNGTQSNTLFAERTGEGWRSRQVTPPRSALIGAFWGLEATSDLAIIAGANYTNAETTDMAVWRLSPFSEPHELFDAVPPQARRELPVLGLSADGRRQIMLLASGAADPAYPSAGNAGNLYDVGTSPPHLISVLPGDVPACVESYDMPDQATINWISADGSRVYFPSRGSASSCTGASELYMREVEASKSTLLSGPVVSGPDCGGTLLRATEDAVFFWSQSRLVASDTAPASCGSEPGDGDVYRYDLGDGSLRCVTCVIGGLDANVFVRPKEPAPGVVVPQDVGVAPDGSRIYFKTKTHLLAGAQPEGEFGAYRVDVESGALAYVAPLGGESHVGETAGDGNALSVDGSVLVFRSNSAKLNPIGGAGGNGGQFQYYRYDDRDRSLVCISCMPDGSSIEGVPAPLTEGENASLSRTASSEDGSTIAFITANPLLGADQNTPGVSGNPRSGQDVYEWRDGRVLLVTDGLTKWPANGTDFEGPDLSGVSRSGRDVYFTVPAQYTPDALDGYRRLYDARIGGGFEFAPPPKPCPLEVCQGILTGAPEEQAPGSITFLGAGNSSAPALKPHPAKSKDHRISRCPKGRRLVRKGKKSRCVLTRQRKKRKGHGSAIKRANHNRRGAR